MIYKIIQPSPHLQLFVKDYLLVHFVFDKNDTVPVKPFPASTLQCLTFYVNGTVSAYNTASGRVTEFPPIAINGALTSRVDYNISNNLLLLSVAFQPCALSKFLLLPLTEFVDARVDAETILNPDIHRAHQQMLNARSYEDIVQIAEAYLWKRIQGLKPDFRPIDKVAAFTPDLASIATVEKMAADACLSVGQFERKFTQLTGISPKRFIRICRFNNAYRLKDNNPNTDWLSIALETGYYDYQHLVKDFQQFAGAAPHSLLDAQAKAPERILGLG